MAGLRCHLGGEPRRTTHALNDGRQQEICQAINLTGGHRGLPEHAPDPNIRRHRRRYFCLDRHQLFPHPSLAMTDHSPSLEEAPASPGRVETLALCCSIHLLHDGCANALYVLFPLIALDLQLSFAQVGLLKTAYTWALSGMQIPASFLAERTGEILILSAGTALLGLSLVATALVISYAFLVWLLTLAGGGSGVQHPLASSLVSHAYASAGRRTALGTYNVSGDLGKVMLPGLIGVLAASWGWRGGFVVLGLFAVTTGGVLGLYLAKRGTTPPTLIQPRPANPSQGWGILDRRRFRRLTLIGMLDDSTRTSFLTFLPFLLVQKGMGPEEIGLVFTLLFAGGAVGKFLCGVLADRCGIVPMILGTEILTGALILALLPLSSAAVFFVIPLVGLVLNGTSSVLYGTVPELVAPQGRSRGYALYYTVVMATGAAAPFLAGLLSDATGLSLSLGAISATALAAGSLSLFLRVPPRT